MRIVTLNPPLVIGGKEMNKFSKDSRSPAVSKGGCVYYPFWLAYATGLLEQEGHNVKLVDAPARGTSKEETLRTVIDFKPELVIVQTVTASFYNDIDFCEKLKTVYPNVFIALSGDHVTALPTESINASNVVDAVIIGELDFTARDLALALEQGKDLAEVNGLVWKRKTENGEQIVYNAPREFASGEDLDEIPFVSKVYKKHLVIEDYFYPSVLYPEVTIWTARGCKYRCTFCVDKDTVIVIKDSEGVKADKISSLFDSTLDNKGKKLANYQVADVSDKEMFVLSKGEYTKIKKASRTKTDKIIELKLETGKRIRLTNDHTMPVKRNGELIEINAGEIKPSDKLNFSKNKKLGVFETKKINLVEEFIKKVPERELKDVYAQNLGQIFEYLKEKEEFIEIKKRYKKYWKHYKSLPIKEFYHLIKKFDIPEELFHEVGVGGKNILPIPMMLQVAKELMTLIGSFVSEGHYSQHSLVITSGNKETQEILVKAIKKVFPYGYTTMSNESSWRTTQIHFGGKIASMFFRHVLDIRKHAKNKNLPAIIFNVSSELKGECLKALFSGDGGWYGSSRRICYFSSSKTLIEQISLLLTEFGIHHTFKIQDQRGPAKISGYDIHINEKILWIKISSWDDRQKFLEKIGFFGEKHRDLAQHQEKQKPNRIKVLEALIDNKNTIVKISESIGLSYDNVKSILHKLSKENSIQKTILSQRGFAKNVSYKATEFYRDAIKEWPRVQEINEINEEAMVYDLETENSYFDANGLVVHNCKFPQTITSHQYRARSVKSVVDEFEWVSKNLPQVKDIMIEDDTFTQDRERTIAVCREIMDRGLRITWTVNARADLDYETMEWMKKAGCRLMCVGFESGVQEILNNVKKGTTVQKIRKFMEESKKAKMLVHGCFMLGNKGETKETIKKTIAFAKELDPDTAQFFPLMVYPGTEAFEWAKKEGFLTTTNWNEWLLDDGTHNTIISRPGLTSEELVEACDKARLAFYLRPKYILRKILQGVTNPKEFPRTVKAGITFYKYLVRAVYYRLGIKPKIA